MQSLARHLRVKGAGCLNPSHARGGGGGAVLSNTRPISGRLCFAFGANCKVHEVVTVNNCIIFIFNEMMKIFFFAELFKSLRGVSVVTVLKIITHQREVEEFSEGYWTL